MVMDDPSNPGLQRNNPIRNSADISNPKAFYPLMSEQEHISPEKGMAAGRWVPAADSLLLDFS
jgi:hypothetical protein